MNECKQARSNEQLIAEMKDSRFPKTEREHAAVREIERLEQRLAAAESRIAELVSGIKEAQIELIETGKIYALGLSCQKRLVTELEQRLAAQKKASDALHDFAQSVAGGSSWWDDVWPEIEKELEAARPEVKGE